ncbi:putative reverse transcriptase domain-containing protein [Tanacetum coccineum]
MGQPSKDKNSRDDNKRTRTGNAFATTARPTPSSPPRRNYEITPKAPSASRGHGPTIEPCSISGMHARNEELRWNVNSINVRNPTPARGACYECGSTNHFKPTCLRLNKAQGPGGNRPNQVVVDNGGIEPSELGFRYEIEIASRQLVKIDKVIKGCKLEIEGHVFDINLIPFRYGSVDVIIGIDWLSNHKAKMICYEKVVRIPLLDSKVLRVLGERLEEKARLLMSVKASDKKQEEIVVVRDFIEVFPDDLSGFHLFGKLSSILS